MDPSGVIDQYLAAWQRGDPEAAFEWYADDVVMRLPGRSREAGVHEGKPAVISAIHALLARSGDDAVEVIPIDRLTSGDRVAIVLREVVVRGEERLDLRRVNVYTVGEDKIVDIDIFEANQYEVDAFFRLTQPVDSPPVRLSCGW